MIQKALSHQLIFQYVEFNDPYQLKNIIIICFLRNEDQKLMVVGEIDNVPEMSKEPFRDTITEGYCIAKQGRRIFTHENIIWLQGEGIGKQA